MKLLFENWRKYLKEAREQPLEKRILHDIGGFSGNVPPSPYDTPKSVKDNQRSTPGYGADENLIKNVKHLMDKTKQDWMFITAKNVGSVSSFVGREKFIQWFDGWIAEWFQKNNKPENYLDNTIFLVIQSPQLKGDEKGAEWLIHDIIGHSIYYNYQKTPPNYRPTINFDFINYVQKQIGGPATADFDRLPDVFADIILGNLKIENMKEYETSYLQTNQDDPDSPVNQTITDIFDYTNWWTTKYLKRGPKPENLNFVELWNPTDPNDK
jgi:hypothetical protein